MLVCEVEMTVSMKKNVISTKEQWKKMEVRMKMITNGYGMNFVFEHIIYFSVSKMSGNQGLNEVSNYITVATNQKHWGSY